MPPTYNRNERYIDGSYTGRTFPAYLDNDNNMGELVILRLQGVDDRPLPNAPFMIRKSISRYLNGRIDSAFKEGGGRTYALKTRSVAQVQKLLEMVKLDDGTPIQIIEHPVHNSIKCMVFNRDVIDFPTTELEEELADQDVTKVHRITKRTGEGRENTPLLVCTIRGTVRPEHLYFGYDRIPTRPYYPSPMQCFNCWAFGHTKLRCKAAAPVCGNCSGTHPITEDRKCNEPTYCRKCKNGEHPLGSRTCPEYQRENSIQKIRVDFDCSYPEARRRLQEETNDQRPSYAQVANNDNRNAAEAVQTGTTHNNSTDFQRLSSRIEQLITVIEQRDQRISALEASVFGGPAMATTNPSIEELMAQQETKFNAIIANLERQNENLRAMNLKLLNEVSELRKSIIPRPAESTMESESTNDTPETNTVPPTKNTSPENTITMTPTPADGEPEGTKTPLDPRSLDPSLDGVFSDSDNPSPDYSPNRPIGGKDTPRPATREAVHITPKGQRPNLAQQTNKTPKRNLAAAELTSRQQQKKSKHKSAPDSLGNRPNTK